MNYVAQEPKNGFVNCTKLTFGEFENNSTRNHFKFFGGEFNFTDSVLFILINK
jgi:hypothetical protein